MVRFEVDLDRETTYRLLTAPEYVQPDCLLPGDPQILASPRQTLARSLASDCPETAAADLYDLEDLEDYLKIALEFRKRTPARRTATTGIPGFPHPAVRYCAPRRFRPPVPRDRQTTETISILCI